MCYKLEQVRKDVDRELNHFEEPCWGMAMQVAETATELVGSEGAAEERQGPGGVACWSETVSERD